MVIGERFVSQEMAGEADGVRSEQGASLRAVVNCPRASEPGGTEAAAATRVPPVRVLPGACWDRPKVW